MANKKIQATATLFLDTKDAQNDAKKFVNDLKQKLSQVETAADKMTVFKDMVAYIAQVDRALAALRKNNKDAFNSMFDGLDSNLKQQLEGLFGVNGAQLGQVEVLREKLNTLTLKSSIKEIRTFAKEINTLFTSIGVSAPFDNIDEQFSGRTNTGHIQALATSLANFATVWEDLSARVSQGFGGAGGFGSGVFGGLNKEVQEEIDKLKKQKEELQEVIDSINQKPLQLKLTKKNDTSELKRLLGEYNDVKSKMDSSDYNNLSFEEQNKILAERIRLANLLKQANEHIVIQDKGSMDAYDIASIGAGQSTIADAQTFLENFYKDSKGKAEELRKLYIGLVSDIDSRLRTLQGPSTSHDSEDTVSLYDKLNEKMKEYLELKKQLANVEKDTPEYNRINDRQRAIQDEVLALKELSAEQEDSLYGIFDDIDENDVPFKNVLNNICNTLGIEIPQATTQAGEQIDTFGKKIVNVSEYVSALSGQLKEMFAATGRSANFEYHIAIDGLDIKARHGSEKSVDLATQTETYLDTLFSDSVLYGHSHRGGTSATNIYDIETVLGSYRDGVSIPVHFVVGKDSITTMDFTGLSKDMTNQLMQEIAATNSNKNAPVINESINKIVEKFTGNSGALKTWNVEQFDDLAKYIYDVSSAASSALTPIEKFQAVLDNMFGKGKVDAAQYESLLSGLDKDNAKSIFNQIASIENLQPIKTTDMLTMGQVNAEIDESIAKYKTLREEANLSYADIRNEVDKVIEHYNAGGSATSGLDFFQKYFPEGEWQNVRNLLTDAYDNLISIEEVTNRIAGEFGVDPDTFAQIPNGVQVQQIDNAKVKLEEFLAFADKMQHENLYGSAENNVDIGRYIERLETAKIELEALGAQGLITAEDLEKVNRAFAEATSHLEAETSHYDSYYNGPSYDYYDEYKEQQERAESAEGENTRLQRQLDTMRQLSDIDRQIGLTYDNNIDELDGLIEERKTLLNMAENTNSLSEEDLQTQRAITREYEERSKFIHEGYDSAEKDLQKNLEYLSSENMGELSLEDIDGYINRLNIAYNKLEEAFRNNLMGDADTFYENIEGPYLRAIAELEIEKERFQKENNDLQQKDIIASNEVVQLEALQQKLLEVRQAVDEKTKAFEEEYVTVNGVVDAEITSLQSLITQLHEVVTQINLINDGFNNINTNAPKIELKSAPTTGSSVDDINITDEVKQLNKLQTVLTEVKNVILSKTKAFVDEGYVVGQVVGKEIAALNKLLETINEIVPKVDSLATKMAGIGPIDFVAKKDGGVVESGTTTEDKFKTRVNAKKSSMTKYINGLKNVQYVTDDTREQLVGLRDALDTVKTPKDLNDIISKFEKLQTEIGILKASFEKTGLNDIQNVERSLLGSFNTLDIDQKRELEPERDAVIKQLETYKNTVLNGQKVELSAIEDTVKALRKKIEVYKQANKEAKDAETAQKKNSKFGDTASRNATAKYNSLMGSATSDQFANSKEVAAIATEYEKAYNAMITMRNELRNSDGVISDADEAEFKRLTTECNEYAKALDKLIKNTMKLKGNKANPNDYILGNDFVDDAQGRKQALTDFVKSVYDIDVAAEDFKKDWNEVVFAVDNGDGTFTQMTATFTAARNEIVALAGDTNKVRGKFESFIDGVKNRLQSLSQYFIATVGIYDVWNVIKQGINHVREIDTALTELKKVTDETDASYDKFLQNMSKTGSVIGATVKDLTTMASEWARLGYSLQEAGKLAESTAILLNVSEFQDATAASEALISTMQAFQYTADESGYVVDILNEVGNNYAVSSDGIATALQDSASALMEGGNNLEQAVALVAAANRVVQDPNSVGSALRTISLRLRGTSVKVLEEIGEETDGVVESTSKLQEKIEALSGVDILTDSGEYKDTYTILKEIGQVWEDMSDIDQAALLELMAGKNRANTLSAILSNMKDLEGAYNDALQAEGSAMRENQAYLDSIQGRIDLFNNAVQIMWMNLLDTDVVKGVVNLGTAFIKFLDSSAGRVTALGAALSILGKVLKIAPVVSSANGQLQIFGKTVETIKNNFAQLSEQSTGVFGKIKSAFASVFTDSSAGKIDLSGMLSEYSFNEKLNGLIAGFNNIDQSINAISWDDYVNGVSKSDQAMGAALKTCTSHNGTIIAGTNAYQAYTGAATTAAVGTSTVGGAAQATTGKLIAMKVAALAANAALTMGLSLIISLAMQGVIAWANAGETARKAAQDAVNASEELREQNESLKDYKDQIRELGDELNSNTLSEQEAYNAREKLLTIQNELINKFGLEKDGLNLVTGAIEEQIAAIDKLSQKNAQQWLNNNQKSINKAITYFDNGIKGGQLDSIWELGNTSITNWGSSDRVHNMIDEYAADRKHISTYTVSGMGQDIDFSGSVEEVKTEVEEFQTWLDGKEDELNTELFDLTSLPASEKTQNVQDQIKSLKNDISQLQDVREDIGVEYTKWFGPDSIYAANKALLEETQYNTALTQYEKEYGNILQAQNDLAEAQAKGDKDGIVQALAVINSETEAASETARKNGQSYMISFFDGIKDGYSSLTKDMEISESLSTLEGKNTLSQALLDFKDNNAKEILQAYKIDPDDSAFVKLKAMADSYEISVEELIQSLVRLGYIQGDFDSGMSEQVTVTTSSIDTLTSAVEAYKTALEHVNNISFDGQAISEDYYKDLKGQLSDITVGAEGFSDAIKEQNGKYIVKNVALLKKLIAQSRQAKKATIEVAKAQAQLQYRDIVDEMQNTVMMMGIEYQANSLITAATLDNISAMREQIDTLKQAIQQYALLEVSLSNAASAYDEYEAAKERDAQLTYDESFLEMIKTIDDGLLKNKTGTEEFEYSTKAVVPEEVFAGIDDPNKKVKAIHDYIDGDSVFSKLFHVDGESGDLDITADNVREFIKLSEEAGMISGTPEGFELSDTVYGTKEWADALGITEAAVLALLSATEDCDALWGDILTDVMTHPLDREINKSVEEVDKATKDLEDYLKLIQETNSDEDESNDVEFDSEHYNELVSNIGAANKKLEENRQAALDNAQTYNTVQAALSSFRGDLVLTDDEAANLANSLKQVEGLEDLGEITIEDGQLKLTDEQLTLILGKLGKITEPSVVQIQLRYDEISNEIDQINEYIKKGSTGSITIDGIVFTNGADADGNAIEDYLAKLTAEQKEIQLTYNITETSTAEQKSVLESYQEIAKNGVNFTVTANVTQAKDSLSEVSEEQNKIDEDQKITVTAYASTAEKAIKDVADQLDRIKSKTVTLTVSSKEEGASGALGNAMATGNVGLKSAERGAVVGELGPEMVVDPIKGRYYTVGDNGTEMVNLPKGAIIYNHKQTAELLKNGHTTRGRYTGGLSFAKGNAYSSYGIPSYHPNLKDKTSFKNGTDVNNTWDDAASTLNGSSSKLSNAADKLSDTSDKFEEVFDWIEVRLEEINEDIGLKSAELENAVGSSQQNAIIDNIIDLNRSLYYNLIAGANEYYNYAEALLSKVPAEYREAAQDGAIAIEKFVGKVDEKTLKAIQDYREWVQKGADATQQAEEVLTEIQSLAKQAFDNIVNDFENKLSLNDNKIDRFDSHNSLLETDKGFESENIYQAMISENESKLKILAQQRDAMQAELNTGKIKEGTDAWYEAIDAIAEVDTEIVNLQVEVEDLQDNINELHWEKFEVLMKQFKAINDEAENLLDILGADDAIDEFGNWTDKGIASLGLLAQQMEVAEMQAEQYKEEIEYLNENWGKLGYTQEEYIDKLNELKSDQYDSIQAYHDAKDAIVDLNKERVDAIKDGIEKEIDAYEELINKKKEALDADKDAHDWQKSVAEQQKNISDIERQIAALSADNSISARAKRAQLEAELLEAKAEMDEMHYDRTVDKQKEALDKELESFQETKEDEIEYWEKYLENVELVVSDTIAMVQENTQTVLETLTILGQEFGLTITEALTNPWKAGETAIQNYGEKLNMSLTELAALFGMTVDEFAAKLDLTTEGLVSKLDITVAEMATSLGLTEEQLAAKFGLTTADLSGKMNMTIQQFAASMGYTIPQLANKLGTTTSGLVGNLNMTMTQFAGRLGLTVDQLAGKFGLTTKGLAAKLGQTYQQLTNPFGMSMSATVDALKSLEKEYQKILNDIESQSLATVSRVNHAMDTYINKSNNNTSTSSKPKTVTLGSRINAGNAKIYSDSYGGGAGTQYYGNDPIYTVIGENNGYWLVRYHKLSSGYTGWFKKSDVKAYAKGTTSMPKDQWALIDELGDELQLIPDGRGRLSYMKKGTGVVPADLTANLMEWGKLDPSVMLDQNRPQIGASPSVVNNTTEVHIDASVGELLHVEHLDGNNPAEITKIVDKAWDKRMKELNSFVRKYSR